MAPGADGSSPVGSDLLRDAVPVTGHRRLPTINPSCAMPSIGPVSFVLPENLVHGVISRSFRPIFAKLQCLTHVVGDLIQWHIFFQAFDLG